MPPILHRVAHPFSPSKAGSLAICCSDGRYIAAVERFLAERQAECHDLIALPGGPARLCMESASIFDVSVAMEAVDLLVKSHQTHTLLLLSHVDCGYYKARYGISDDERQRTDLKTAASRMKDRYPTLKTSLYLSRPAGSKPADGFIMEEVPSDRS